MSNENKKQTKKKSNNKCLYTCQSIVDAYEYKKMAKYFPEVMYLYFVRMATFSNIIFTALTAILSRSWIIALVFFLVYEIFLLIYYKVRIEFVSERVFIKSNKGKEEDNNFENEFYEDHFIRKTKKSSLKINYSEISKCIENDTNFYLKYPDRKVIIIIQKNRCDNELINFIRAKFDNLENHLGDNSNFKGIKKYHNPDFIKTFMIILFIVTIFSLWAALWSISLADKINPQYGSNFIKNAWVFWLWLPIPLLSIIFGFKYKNAGFRCTKNIVGGFIVAFLLLIYGSFCLFPTFSQDYSKIDAYRNIIDANLPDNGELEIQDWETNFEDDKINYTIIDAYYYKEDVSKLEQSIENSPNWILSKEIKSTLKILIPQHLRADEDAYFSIYNKTTNEYNTIPKTSGNYEIYAIKYDKSDKHLEMCKFTYLYK